MITCISFLWKNTMETMSFLFWKKKTINKQTKLISSKNRIKSQIKHYGMKNLPLWIKFINELQKMIQGKLMTSSVKKSGKQKVKVVVFSLSSILSYLYVIIVGWYRYYNKVKTSKKKQVWVRLPWGTLWSDNSLIWTSVMPFSIWPRSFWRRYWSV